MELNSDLMCVQGALIALEKSIGEFKKIKHKGGNEPKIAKIVTELEEFLVSKNYLKNAMPNEIFTRELTSFLLFLISNTDLGIQLELEDYCHLVNIIPQFSKCLLANVIIELNLIDPYCTTLKDLPLEVIEPLIIELIPCLKKCTMSDRLLNTYTILSLIIFRLLQADALRKPVQEIADKLTDVSSQILFELTGIHGDQYSSFGKNGTIYENMGRTLHQLFNLLLKCDLNNVLITRIIENVITTCSTIVMAVTIDVYCYWAEIECDHRALQSLVGEAAYLFIEKYQKFKPAKEIITMLGQMAQKPKSLNELIHQADDDTMIMMINKSDSNQKQWFKALLNTHVLQNKDAVSCIHRWACLSTPEDVSRLLSLLSNYSGDEQDAKKLIIRCAATLSLDDLRIVSVRHLFKSGIFNKFNDDVQQQLTLLFNKLKDASKVDVDFAKEIHLLLLQNPEQVLSFVFGECLRNGFYTLCLKNVFPSFREIANVEKVGLKVLNKEMKNNLSTDQNSNNYRVLFNTLIEVEFYSLDSVILECFLPMMNAAFLSSSHDILKVALEIVKDFPLELRHELGLFFDFLLVIMQNYRCKFFKFDRIKQEIVKDVVDIIEKCCEGDSNYHSEDDVIIADDDMYTTFYKMKLFRGEAPDLLRYFNPEIRFENHAEIVTHLIKLLPISTRHEWISMALSLCEHCGSKEASELLTDGLILICHLVKSQETKTEEVKSMLSALKYCLQLYGTVLMVCLYPRVQNLEEDVTITRNVCRLLKDIPVKEMKSEEGLSLANLLSEKSLKSLRTDKTFAYSIVAINESAISQMLAQKMLK